METTYLLDSRILYNHSCKSLYQDLDNELTQIMTGLKANFQQIYRIASIIDKEFSPDSKHTTALGTVTSRVVQWPFVFWSILGSKMKQFHGSQRLGSLFLFLATFSWGCEEWDLRMKLDAISLPLGCKPAPYHHQHCRYDHQHVMLHIPPLNLQVPSYISIQGTTVASKELDWNSNWRKEFVY
jgi:hypothetical protein